MQATLQLANMQTQFSHQAIDYGYQINTIGCVKTHAIVDNVSVCVCVCVCVQMYMLPLEHVHIHVTTVK